MKYFLQTTEGLLLIGFIRVFRKAIIYIHPAYKIYNLTDWFKMYIDLKSPIIVVYDSDNYVKSIKWNEFITLMEKNIECDHYDNDNDNHSIVSYEYLYDIVISEHLLPL